MTVTRMADEGRLPSVVVRRGRVQKVRRIPLAVRFTWRGWRDGHLAGECGVVLRSDPGDTLACGDHSSEM